VWHFVSVCGWVEWRHSFVLEEEETIFLCWLSLVGLGDWRPFCKPHGTDPRVSLSTWHALLMLVEDVERSFVIKTGGEAWTFSHQLFLGWNSFFVTFDRSKFPGTFPVKLDRGEKVFFFWLRLLLHELNIQKTMPSDWYFGPVVCVCLLSRIFFSSFPRRRPSELPPLKRHFERKKKGTSTWKYITV
jgi:hypothetical protein